MAPEVLLKFVSAMYSPYDELLYDYNLEKQLLIKSLEGSKRMLVMMINSVQESSKAKDGETRWQKEHRHFNLYTCSEYIPQVSNEYAPDE